MRTCWFEIPIGLVLLTCASPQETQREVADAGWLARAQQHIAAREYRASGNGQGLQAPNRAHNLRTYFAKTGIRVHDRTAPDSPELLRLSLAGVGRADRFSAPKPGAEIVANENRVEIRRPGLVEWYVNSEAGLEQGLTLEERPNGDGPLVVAIAAAGARPSLLGDAVLFETAQRKLRFGTLVATDGGGDPLPAHFEVPRADRVRIVVDDARATYPVVIDPLLTETADTTIQSDEASASFGVSVSGAGDVNGDGFSDVIVGAHLYDVGGVDAGAAFVFLGSASGIADGNVGTAPTELLSSQTGAQFGSAVASAGDVNGDGYGDVIVGSFLYDAGDTDEGAAFVFRGSASGIPDSSPATLGVAQLETNQANATVAGVAGVGDVDGDGYDDVVVGSPLWSNGQIAEGAAWLFRGSSSGIASGNPGTAYAARESDQAFALFGLGVARAGDVNGDGLADALISAPRYDFGPQTDAGAAFLYYGNATFGLAGGALIGSNQANAGWRASSQSEVGVAGAGDVNGDGYADVIVGFGGYDDGETDEGAAFLFLGSGTGITGGGPSSAAAKLVSNQGSALFGRNVAGAGDVNGDGYADVIVGARQYDAGESDEGAAFVFLGGASGVGNGDPTTAFAQLEPNQASAYQGVDVAGAGDVNGDGYADVIVGAHQYDAGQTDEGAAFVYLGGADGIADGNPTTAVAQLEPNQTFAGLGYSVAGAGDVNGDGYDDVIVGAYAYDAGESDEGAAFVFHGSSTGIADGDPTSAPTQLESNQATAYLGWSVAGAGDVNGDGYADVIVGSYLYDAGQTNEGAAFVFRGSASGIASGNPASPGVAQLESDQANAVLGSSVAGAGDVNGDGYADVIVGAESYDAGEGDEGAAFVFRGSASGIASGNPATSGVARLESDQVSAFLGQSVAGAGDVNGDGYADVIAGSPFYNAGQPAEGAAFVFHGSSTGIANGTPATAAAQLESDQASAQFGRGVSGAGDVNGDGYADVIVGARFYDAGDTDEGAAFVFLGSSTGVADGTPATAAAQLESEQASANLGIGVAGAGDLNGDGYADVIVGALQYDAGETDEGAAFVFLGSSTGVADGTPATAAAQLESDQASATMGLSVAGAGDTNGDGHADVIVSAYQYDAGQINEGAAFVFLGNGAGRPVLARQRRGNGSGIAVQPFGLAYSITGFTAELRASHPAGSGRVKAELQACPQGVPFGNGSCTTALTSSWVAVDDATPEALLSHTFSGLANHTLYRWRARVLHAPATGAIPANPAHGPWRRLGAQSAEGDIRLPEPGLLVSLAWGVALIAALDRRLRIRSIRA